MSSTECTPLGQCTPTHTAPSAQLALTRRRGAHHTPCLPGWVTWSHAGWELSGFKAHLLPGTET